MKKVGWRSKTKINQGLIKTIDWYLNNKNFLRNIHKKNYEKRLGLRL